MDLTKFLHDWTFEHSGLIARRFVGEDGKTKIQLRIDLGVMQMEYHDRPDGKRPGGFPHTLAFYRDMAERSEIFELEPDMIFQLRQEAIQFYHRYLSLYQLKDYRAVIRDTRHNLDIINFLTKHSPENEIMLIQQHRPHVMMMNTSAKVMLKIEEKEPEEAMRLVRIGMSQIKKVYRQILDIDQPELAPELYQLKELQHRITDDGIPSEISPIENLEIELEMALLSENYEQAAALRDKISRKSSQN